jgi:hypothetical protein
VVSATDPYGRILGFLDRIVHYTSHILIKILSVLTECIHCTETNDCSVVRDLLHATH